MNKTKQSNVETVTAAIIFCRFHQNNSFSVCNTAINILLSTKRNTLKFLPLPCKEDIPKLTFRNMFINLHQTLFSNKKESLNVTPLIFTVRTGKFPTNTTKEKLRWNWQRHISQGVAKSLILRHLEKWWSICTRFWLQIKKPASTLHLWYSQYKPESCLEIQHRRN
jgi:hypothetical protein